MNILKRILPVLFIIILSYFAVAHFFVSGFFPMHDDTQVQRVYEMKTALADGMFPVRWVPDLGYSYGYPIFNFYAPLAYYFGGLVMLLGIDALLATKVMMVFGIIFAGVSMYFLAKEFWGERGAIVSALLYVYAPYHALQIYVRGDVAEFWGYSFIPLAFLGVYKLCSAEVHKRKGAQAHSFWWWIVVGSLSFAGIILSHNLTAMMVTPFLLGFAIALGLFRNTQNTQAIKETNETQGTKGIKTFVSFVSSGSFDPFRNLLKLCSPLFIGILLASFYWLPTLMEMKYADVLSVIGGGSDFRDHYVCPIQLWDSPWGFAGSAPGCIDGMSFKIGKLHVLLAIISIIGVLFLSLFRHSRVHGNPEGINDSSSLKSGKNYFYLLDSRLRGNDKKERGNDKKEHGNDKKEHGSIIAMLFFIFSLFLSIFLMLDWSRSIWEILPKMDYFQFPWRFLIMISFLASFLGGSVVWIFQEKVKNAFLLWGATFVICAGVIYANTNVFQPQTISPRTAEDYVSKKNLTWDTSKISDEYMPPGFDVPENEFDVPTGKIAANEAVRVVTLTEQTQRVEAVLEAQKETTVRLHIADFPAWNISIDGENVPYRAVDNGLEVTVPAGNHTVVAEFVQTPVERIANVLSLTGVLTLILGIIRFNYKFSKHG